MSTLARNFVAIVSFVFFSTGIMLIAGEKDEVPAMDDTLNIRVYPRSTWELKIYPSGGGQLSISATGPNLLIPARTYDFDGIYKFLAVNITSSKPQTSEVTSVSYFSKHGGNIRFPVKAYIGYERLVQPLYETALRNGYTHDPARFDELLKKYPLFPGEEWAKVLAGILSGRRIQSWPESLATKQAEINSATFTRLNSSVTSASPSSTQYAPDIIGAGEDRESAIVVEKSAIDSREFLLGLLLVVTCLAIVALILGRRLKGGTKGN